MAALPDDITHLDEPHTYREMFQRIMWLMEKDRDDRQEDRELLESFITSQKEINEELKNKVSNLETCNGVQDEAISTLKKRVDGWNSLNSLGVIIASILAALGLKGS